MSIFEAMLLGVIQGLTEFLPVSSSGHLAICEQLLGIDTDGGLLFDVLLHLGTLGAIFAAFKKDIKRLILEAFRIVRDIWYNLLTFWKNLVNREENRYRKIIGNNYRKFVVMIVVSAVPTGLIGYWMEGTVEVASQTLLFPGLGLLVTGILLLVVDFVETGKKIPKDASFKNALIVGICQGISAFPGISRSGTTITAGLLCGFNRKFAVKFSFLMSIPAILGAVILELTEAVGGSGITGAFAANSIVGMIFAGIVGFFCIRKMLVLVQRKKLRYFSYYCFIIGIAAIVGNFLL